MSARFIAGIDPGLSGAVALYDPATSEVQVVDMPVFNVTVAGKKRRQIDLAVLARWFDFRSSEIKFAVLEDVGPQPQDGAKAAFSFGRSFGIVEMAVASNFIAARYVSPAVWKRAMGLTGDKDMSRRLASRLLPSAAHLWPLVKHDGRAEAVLLAVYGSKAG